MTTELNNGLAAPSESAGKWEKAAWRIGTEVAAPAADEVDRDARFPHETVDALKAEGFMSAILPTELGGDAASLADLVGAVRAMASHCASSALVLAMHNIEVYTLGRHGTTPELRQLAKDVGSKRLLFANANSEVGVGGDINRSICALDDTVNPWRLDKKALAISYGEYADVILTKARRNPEAAENDQVLIAVRKPSCTLEEISGWDTLGLRGTCSKGFRMVAEVAPADVFPVPLATVANDGGQIFQLLLSAAWVGLAEAAGARAHTALRASARKSIGTLPPTAIRVAEIAANLQAARSLLVAQAMRFEWLEANGSLDDPGFTMGLRNLKVTASSLGVATATAALGVCGIAGYQRTSEISMDRIIRDAHGGLIMVNNERYLNDNAQQLLARRQL
jgi:acyl-CoA dehydrogenase